MNRGASLLANNVRQQAKMAAADMAWPRLSTISSYDPNTHAVKLTVQPSTPNEEPTESNWMPLGAIGIGNGWGVAVGPQIGDQVLVVYEHGDFNSGTIVARIFSVVQQAPAVPSGEIWATHKLGAFLKLTNDGKLAINSQVEIDASGPTINIQATGNVNVVAAGQANVTAPSINLGASGQSLLSFITSAFQSLFNSHTHKTNAVGSQTDPTLTPITSSHLTTTVKGG